MHYRNCVVKVHFCKLLLFPVLAVHSVSKYCMNYLMAL